MEGLDPGSLVTQVGVAAVLVIVLARVVDRVGKSIVDAVDLNTAAVNAMRTDLAEMRGRVDAIAEWSSGDKTPVDTPRPNPSANAPGFYSIPRKR